MHFAKLGNCTCYNQKIAFQNRARSNLQNLKSIDAMQYFESQKAL